MSRPKRKSSILRGAEQALEFARGNLRGARVTTVSIASGSVKEIRRKMNLSQAEFAAQFGFTPATVRNWEQGRNKPDTSARILLAVISRHPDVVRDAAKSVA